jgi:hypothetical protein
MFPGFCYEFLEQELVFFWQGSDIWGWKNTETLNQKKPVGKSGSRRATYTVVLSK